MNQPLRGYESTTDEIIFTHSAPVNQEETLRILDSITSTLTFFNVDPVVKRKLIYISLEMLQNQVQHSEATLAVYPKFNPSFTIANSAGYFHVWSANYLRTEHTSHFTNQLRQLNDLAPNERKRQFSKILKQPMAKSSESTGLGLLDVARRCNNRFNYRVCKLSSQYSFLYLCITLHLDNKA